jgi:uncharacterized membrane protein
VSAPALPLALHEFVVAPASLLVAFGHARKALGIKRAAGELAALVAYGFALERLAMSAFHSHRYGEGWAVAPCGVPLAVAMVWAAVISSALALAARCGLRTAPARAVAAALFAITLDLTMEPVAVRCGFWRWTPLGPWLGVPVGNFVGWLVIVAGYGLGAERWAGEGGFATETLRRIVLAASALAGLVAVGAAWTRCDLEAALGRRGGWLAWAIVLLGTAAVGVSRRPPFDGPTLAGRLGSATGFGPALVFLIVATAFAADAALLADRTIALVALGTALALLPALRASGTASSG